MHLRSTNFINSKLHFQMLQNIISKCVFYEIEDDMFKLELNVNLLLIVIIDVGFARKYLSTVNC